MPEPPANALRSPVVAPAAEAENWSSEMSMVQVPLPIGMPASEASYCASSRPCARRPAARAGRAAPRQWRQGRPAPAAPFLPAGGRSCGAWSPGGVLGAYARLDHHLGKHTGRPADRRAFRSLCKGRCRNPPCRRRIRRLYDAPTKNPRRAGESGPLARQNLDAPPLPPYTSAAPWMDTILNPQAPSGRGDGRGFSTCRGAAN